MYTFCKILKFSAFQQVWQTDHKLLHDLFNLPFTGRTYHPGQLYFSTISYNAGFVNFHGTVWIEKENKLRMQFNGIEARVGNTQYRLEGRSSDSVSLAKRYRSWKSKNDFIF